MGQQIMYKTNLTDKKKKKFWASDFISFETQHFYLETFSVQNPAAVGKSDIMIPRIVNGYLQLFEYRFTGSALWLSGDHFFIKDGRKKERIRRKTFIAQMNVFVGDNEALITDIENKMLTYDNLKQIILRYNKK
jgi:hypothetical protein